MAEDNAHWLRPPIQLPSQGALTNDTTEFQAATPKGAKLPEHVGHSGKRPSKKVHKNKAASLDLLAEALQKVAAHTPQKLVSILCLQPNVNRVQKLPMSFGGVARDAIRARETQIGAPKTASCTKIDPQISQNYVDIAVDSPASSCEYVFENGIFGHLSVPSPSLSKLAAILAPSLAAMFGKEQTAHVPMANQGTSLDPSSPAGQEASNPPSPQQAVPQQAMAAFLPGGTAPPAPTPATPGGPQAAQQAPGAAAPNQGQGANPIDQYGPMGGSGPGNTSMQYMKQGLHVEQGRLPTRALASTIGRAGSLLGIAGPVIAGHKAFVNPSGDRAQKHHDLAKTIEEGAPEGSLQNTKLRLGGSDTIDDVLWKKERPGEDLPWYKQIGGRVMHNPHSGIFGKAQGMLTTPIANLYAATGRSSHYNPASDVATNYMDSPAITGHELGHAIDFNTVAGKPSQNFAKRQLQGLGRDAYSALYQADSLPGTSLIPGMAATKLWHEAQANIKSHDALRKGLKDKPDELHEHEVARSRTLPAGYGSYVGNAVGSVVPGMGSVGALAGLIGGKAYGSMNAERLENEQRLKKKPASKEASVASVIAPLLAGAGIGAAGGAIQAPHGHRAEGASRGTYPGAHGGLGWALGGALGGLAGVGASAAGESLFGIRQHDSMLPLALGGGLAGAGLGASYGVDIGRARREHQMGPASWEPGYQEFWDKKGIKPWYPADLPEEHEPEHHHHKAAHDTSLHGLVPTITASSAIERPAVQALDIPFIAMPKLANAFYKAPNIDLAPIAGYDPPI